MTQRRALLLVALIAILSQWWIVRLPWQLDDFVLVANPWALFGHVDQLASDDVPAFMCRIPMWIAWGLVHLITPEPLSVVPFHLAGLALHATAAVLLARVVMRHGPRSIAMPAGFVAGAAFGAMGGAMQAVSWTAAWSSLLYTIFALAALNVAMDGRARGSWTSAAAMAAFFYLALITKVPALVATGVAMMALVLTALPRLGELRRRLGVELAWSAGAIVAGLVTRSWFLGTQHLRYEKRVEPGLAEFPGIVATGFHALGQALFPWNRDPVMNGEEPLLAALGLGAPWIALLVFGPILAGAFALAPKARPALLALCVCLVPAVVPPGTIYGGQPTNVVAREAYLPLAVAAALLGVSLLALYQHRRSTGVLAMLVVVVTIADGTTNVATSELLHAEELRATRALLDELADEAEETRPGRELLVFALMPDGGFAGIPSLGGLLALSHQPPFTERRRLDIRTFRHPVYLTEFLADSGDEDLGLRDVVLIGPACDEALEPIGLDPALSGAENRARRLLRRLTPIRHGMEASASRVLRAASDPDTPHWQASQPIPAHAAGALSFAATGPTRGAFQIGGTTLPIDLASGATDVTLELPTALTLRLGPPIERVAWLGGGFPADAVTVRRDLPSLEVTGPEADTDFALTDFLERGPEFTVALPPNVLPGSFARLELRFDLLGWSASVYSDLPFGDLPPTQVTVAPASIHLERAATEPFLGGAPWSALPAERILPTLTAGDLNGATFQWRITLHHRGGTPAARSPFRGGRFVLADDAD